MSSHLLDIEKNKVDTTIIYEFIFFFNSIFSPINSYFSGCGHLVQIIIKQTVLVQYLCIPMSQRNNWISLKIWYT